MAGIHGETLGFGNLDAIAGVPWFVREFEHGADRTVCEHLPCLPVVRDEQFLPVPHAGAAAPTVRASVVHVQPLPRVGVVVPLDIPAVNDEVADPLAPDVDPAADHATAVGRGRVEPRTVNAVGDAVVFPRKIVEPLGHIAGEDPRRKGRHGRGGFLDRKGGRLFPGGKIVLEDEVAVVVVALLRLKIGALHGDHRTGGVFHRQVVEQHAGQQTLDLAERNRHDLRGTGDIEIVGDGHDDLFGGPHAQRAADQQGKDDLIHGLDGNSGDKKPNSIGTIRRT